MKVAFPEVTPVTTPRLLTVATPMLLLIHVPPVAGDNCTVLLTQTALGEETTGKAVVVKFPTLVPIRDGVVTVIVPEVPNVGNVAVICVELFTTNEAGTPLKLTDVAPLK